MVTKNISQTSIPIEGRTFHFIDVSGLQHQRKAWVPFFEEARTIVFMVSLSSYDQVTTENPSLNRMEDALACFKDVMQDKKLRSKNIILFYNKKDLFKIKLQTTPINNYFPLYDGRSDSLSQGTLFFKHLFSQCTKRRIYSHVTCATDTASMKKIFLIVL